MSAKAAIAVFDSGLGGLTVLKVLLDKFPNEDFIYLGDTARLPYGAKSSDTIRKYTEQNLKFLSKYDIKLIVIACNSASSTYPKSHFGSIPVLTVIKPGAERAVQDTVGRIGVFGTRATIKSNVYKNSVIELAKKINKEVDVFSVAAPLFVPIVEEGWIDDPITNLIAFRYSQELLQHKVDTVIMGCTHYPVLKNSFRKIFGNQVKLIDSGEAIAAEISKIFNSGTVHRNENTDQNDRIIKILVSDFSEQFEKMTRMLLSPYQPTSIETVDII